MYCAAEESGEDFQESEECPRYAEIDEDVDRTTITDKLGAADVTSVEEENDEEE